MATPELNQDNYTPEEVHNLIKENLGEDVASQFRMYFNKVQKVPPHKIQAVPIQLRGDESFEYRFLMGDFEKEVGIPPEVLEFVMVPSERHGGGSQDNMGWVRMIFKTITSPQGNEVKIAIIDEIQSDFSQRVGRLRQLLNGKMSEDDLIGYEKEAWNKIKNNDALVEVKENSNSTILEQLKAFSLKNGYDYGNTLNNANVFLRAKGSDDYQEAIKDFYINPEVITEITNILNNYSGDNVNYPNSKSTIVATQQLKSIINKIESTSYSDILKYLFNKALGFAKTKGSQQVWVPSSEMKVAEWKGNAKHGIENMAMIFKRVYDDNSVTFEAIRDLEKKLTGEDYWVIDLGNVQDIKLANKIRLSAYWKDETTKIDSNNWKSTLPAYIETYFKTFIDAYQRNYNPEDSEQKMMEQESGGTAYDETSKDAVLYEAMDNFIQYLESNLSNLVGNTEAIDLIKSTLKSKFGFDLPAEKESKLLYVDEGSNWKEVKKHYPKEEIDSEAPSAEELNNLFKFSRNNDYKGYE